MAGKVWIFIVLALELIHCKCPTGDKSALVQEMAWELFSTMSYHTGYVFRDLFVMTNPCENTTYHSLSKLDYKIKTCNTPWYDQNAWNRNYLWPTWPQPAFLVMPPPWSARMYAVCWAVPLVPNPFLTSGQHIGHGLGFMKQLAYAWCLPCWQCTETCSHASSVPK